MRRADLESDQDTGYAAADRMGTSADNRSLPILGACRRAEYSEPR